MKYHFLIALISLVASQAPNSTIIWTVSDKSVEVLVNDVDISAGKSPLNDWTYSKLVNVQLRPGNIIVFRMERLATGFGVGGLIATIKYTTSDNRVLIYNTDANGWSCNGNVALTFGKNTDPTTLWFQNLKSSVPNISGDAYWIWAKGAPNFVFCTFRIPCNE